MENLDEDNVVVVTHGMFMRIMCAVILVKDNLTPRICYDMMMTLQTKNTGITFIKQNKKKEWRVITWNDHTHFAEYN